MLIRICTCGVYKHVHACVKLISTPRLFAQTENGGIYVKTYKQHLLMNIQFPPQLPLQSSQLKDGMS